MIDNTRSYPLNHAEDNERKLFCPVCGAEVPKGSRFCLTCGSDMEAEPGMIEVYAGPEYFNKDLKDRPMGLPISHRTVSSPRMCTILKRKKDITFA